MRPHSLAAAVTAALLVATAVPARSAPSVRYTWDECDPIVLDREFVGPGHYTQTVSVTGLTQPLTAFQVNIAVGLSQPSAWQFYTYGCQGPSRLTTSSAASGCLSLPGAYLTVQMYPGLTDFRLHIQVSGTAPPGAVPDPSARYALVRLDFDHSFTTVGTAPPGYCGNGDWNQCFGIEYLALNGGATRGVDYTVENDVITWNLASSPGQCPFPVPVKPSTWGKVKALYR